MNADGGGGRHHRCMDAVRRHHEHHRLAVLNAGSGFLACLVAVRNGRPDQKKETATGIIHLLHDTFKTKDGWVIISVGDNKLWEVLCNAVGRAELFFTLTLKHNPDCKIT